jgi:hypothetical protein
MIASTVAGGGSGSMTFVAGEQHLRLVLRNSVDDIGTASAAP